ncbi:MAG: hypothetical protein QW417_01820 [Zestosphaera sp.]
MSRTSRIIRGLRDCCGVDDIVLVVGGYWGLMKEVVDSALELGFKVLIIPPIEQEEVPFPDEAIVVRTGTSYRIRSVFLVKTSDVLIVLGGGAGCIQELITAYTEGKPSYVLVNTGMPTDIVESMPEYIDHRKLAPIMKYRDENTLLRDLCNHLKTSKTTSTKYAVRVG